MRPCCHLALLDDTNWARPWPMGHANENATELELLPPPVQALRKAEAANLTCSLFNLDEVHGRGVTVMRVLDT